MTERTLLITGCSSGIGYDAAHGMRAAGWRVFASCRKAEDCARLHAEGFESPLIDYANPDSIVTGLAEVLEATGGTLDALFNNGAYACPGAVEDLPRQVLRDMFETNVFGVHELSTLVIPVMRKQGHGRIVNCSSVLGIVAARWRGAYCATKFAIEGLTDTMRLELSGSNIDVILINPGPITSKFRENALAQMERWIDWRGSALRDDFEDMRIRLNEKTEPDRFELPASAVTQKLRRALETKKPRARYDVTLPAYFIRFLRRLLPTRALDWMLMNE